MTLPPTQTNSGDKEEFVSVIDSGDELEEIIEDERRATFQAHFKREIGGVYRNTDSNGRETIQNGYEKVKGAT